jgi:acyl carrier protein
VQLKGEGKMNIGALETIVGIQNLNGRALEKFLASQGYQIGVFRETLLNSGNDSETNNMLRLIEMYQNNSMRAFEAYMKGQRGILDNLDGAVNYGTDQGLFAYEGEAAAVLPQQSEWSPDFSGLSDLSDLPDRNEVGKYPAEAPVTELASHQVIPQDRNEAGKYPVEAPVTELASHQVIPLETAISFPPAEFADVSEDFDPVQVIISIICEKTGYPEEMVDADMNIESDLGIDSIKRIEIFSEFNNQIPGGISNEDVEAVAMLHTISEIGDYFKKKRNFPESFLTEASA